MSFFVIFALVDVLSFDLRDIVILKLFVHHLGNGGASSFFVRLLFDLRESVLGVHETFGQFVHLLIVGLFGLIRSLRHQAALSFADSIGVPDLILQVLGQTPPQHVLVLVNRFGIHHSRLATHEFPRVLHPFVHSVFIHTSAQGFGDIVGHLSFLHLGLELTLSFIDLELLKDFGNFFVRQQVILIDLNFFHDSEFFKLFLIHVDFFTRFTSHYRIIFFVCHILGLGSSVDLEL